MSSISELVAAADGGDSAAATELFAALYHELHTLAEHHIRRQGGRVSLGTTTLVHEVYLKLSERDGARFPDRQRFLAYASKAMRGLVIDYTRARRAQKRGGPASRVTFDEALVVTNEPREDFVALDDALTALAALDERRSRVIELRFFGGLSVEETALVLKVSPATVMGDWRLAKAWLQREMRGDCSNDA